MASLGAFAVKKKYIDKDKDKDKDGVFCINLWN